MHTVLKIFFLALAVLVSFSCSKKGITELKEERSAFSSDGGGRNKGPNVTGGFSRKVSKRSTSKSGDSKSVSRARNRAKKGEKDAFGRPSVKKEEKQIVAGGFGKKVKGRQRKQKPYVSTQTRKWWIFRWRKRNRLPKEKNAFANDAKHKRSKPRAPEMGLFKPGLKRQ